jgi:hypothetical protein
VGTCRFFNIYVASLLAASDKPSLGRVKYFLVVYFTEQ